MRDFENMERSEVQHASGDIAASNGPMGTETPRSDRRPERKQRTDTERCGAGRRP
jgi:hypothetical protein